MRIVYKGVPQGGVLSPLLFNIYINEIASNIPKSVLISQFADDIALYCKRSPLSSCKRLLEKSIISIQKELNNLGLELSPQKTVLIHFNRNQIAPGQTEITVQETTIKSSETAKFLGIIFDYRLTFRNQISKIQKKCQMALNIMKFIRGTWWGAHPNILLILYKSFVRSIIDYGCFVYFPTQQKLIDQIEKIQYSAIRLALGYRISTPTNILLAESKLEFIQERTKSLCLSYLYKINSNKSLLIHQTITNCRKKIANRKRKKQLYKRLIHNCIEISSSMINLIFSEKHYDIYETNFQAVISSSININTSFGKKLKKIDNPDSKIRDLLLKENSYALYTDGSKSVNSVGAGSACICHELDKTVSRCINKHASIFTAECIALCDAMDIVLENPRKNAIIFSDSLSALISLQHPKFDIRINPYILSIRKKNDSTPRSKQRVQSSALLDTSALRNTWK